MDVIVLAGGLGTRLRSVVSEVPKCMAPVAGQPFLYYLLEQLPAGKTGKVVLSVGYLKEKIFDWMDGVRDRFPFAVEYAVEETPLGTGGGIRMALEKCTDDYVAVLNGDTFFDADLQVLQEALAGDAGRSGLAVALKPMKDFDRYGRVDTDRTGLVTAFREKCACREGEINGGVYVADRKRLLEELAVFPEKFSFESDFLQGAASRGIVRGVRCGGYFIDIGIPSDYARAQQEFMLAGGAAAFEGVQKGVYDTLFLDRDGVVNRLRPGDYVKAWSEFEFLPGVLRLFSRWNRIFRHIVVVTNQRGVGRGLMTPEALEEVHRRMLSEVSAAGGRIDAVYVCTAVSNDDPRRKPNTGMMAEVMADFGDIDLERSVMIGDSAGDREFASRAGIGRFILISWEG